MEMPLKGAVQPFAEEEKTVLPNGHTCVISLKVISALPAAMASERSRGLTLFVIHMAGGKKYGAWSMGRTSALSTT